MTSCKSNFSPILLKGLLLFVVLIFFFKSNGQTPLYSGILVSDTGTVNNIGNANTSRKIAVSKSGIIYVVYTSAVGIRVTKSIDRGQGYLPSVSVTSTNSEAEIIVNDAGFVFVSWSESGNIMLSVSIDQGNTFSTPSVIGTGYLSVHLSVFGSNIYATDKFGEFVYANANNGTGPFISTMLSRRVFADVRTDQNGIVYAPSDNPFLFLFSSMDSGLTYTEIILNPKGNVSYSSYALSDGPCGTYIFVGGNRDLGYKMDVSNGQITQISLGNNTFNNRGRALFADYRGTLIDGYQNNSGDLMINVSNDQGQTFGAPITIAKGDSHNITRNPVFDDIVVVYEQGGQIYVSVYDNLLKSISIPETTNYYGCVDGTSSLEFTLSGGFASNSIFDSYLSDSTGSFANKTLVGSSTPAMGDSIILNISAGTPVGTNYRIQIESAADCVQSNSVPIIISELPAASVSSNGPICSGDDAIFTITSTPFAEIIYSGVSGFPNSPVTLNDLGVATITIKNATANQTILLETIRDTTSGCNEMLAVSETILVNGLPIIRIGNDYTLCVNLNGTEIINTPPIINTSLNTLEYNFSWYLNGTIIP